MCDYSLQNVKSRPAQIGDKLIVSSFHNTLTRGLADADDFTTAVCLLPGTEVAFDENISEREAGYWMWINTVSRETNVGKFVQVNMDNPYVHHDALELPNGGLVMVNNLTLGQRVTVLQLPAAPKTDVEREEQRHAEYV